MDILKKSASNSNVKAPDSIPNRDGHWKDTAPHHMETAPAENSAPNFKVSKTGDGDVALALFSSLSDAKEPIDPVEEKRVVRKIDLMILPYLAVCYA